MEENNKIILAGEGDDWGKSCTICLCRAHGESIFLNETQDNNPGQLPLN